MRSFTKFILSSTMLNIGLASLAAVPSYASPTGGQVSGGQAAIHTAGSKTSITQTSARAVIDWQSFDIGASESVRFHQPSAQAIALNRIHSGRPTAIDGKLTANGQVWVVNPSGVVFGRSAQINVGGLMASTADIANDRFMAGDYRFDRRGDSQGAIINEGAITVAEGGLVAFVAPRVKNSGVIEAKLGKVALASGDSFTLDMYGDGLINLKASPALNQQLVENSGTIRANGGTVTLTAAAAQGAVNSIINTSGIIEANSIGMQNGVVVLSAGGGAALVSGRIDAKGLNAVEKGGSITVTGNNVGVLTGAQIDASGHSGGGTVKIGGDYQGSGNTPRAQRTIVQAGASIKANATHTGNGGKVIVWADNRTDYAGHIEARGGAHGGNGGFVETSGKQILSSIGSVDASAPHGNAGTWLLDPNDITIQAAGSNTNISGTPNFLSTDDSAIVTTASIEAALNGGTNVTITTGAGGTNAQAGDILVASNISKTAGGDAGLTLKAYRNITVDTGVSISSTSGKMNVTLNADASANGSGSIYMAQGSSILTNGGNITLGGGFNPLTNAAVGNAVHTNGIELVGATLNANGGNISLNGKGYSGSVNAASGIWAYGGSVLQTTGNGNITLTGTGGDVTGVSYPTNHGVQLGDYSNYANGPTEATLLAANGFILINGTGGSILTSSGPEGVMFYNSLVKTTGTGAGHGNITINGTAGVSGNWSYGTDIATYNAGTPSVITADGTITITGTSATHGQSQIGLYIWNALIASSGTGAGFGDIILNGISNESIYNAYGIYMGADNNSVPLVSTVNGNIAINGSAVSGTTYGSNYGTYGVSMNDVLLQSTGTGNITLNGIVSGSAHGIYATGVVLKHYTTGSSIKTNTGSISLTGYAPKGGSTNTVDIDVSNNTNSIGGINQHGNITLTADKMNLNGMPITTSGNLELKPYTAGTTIGIGSGAGNLSITDAMLAALTYGSLTIGNLTSGSMDINSSASILNQGSVSFLSGGGITFNHSLAKTSGGNTSILFDAANSILVNSGANITSSSGKLDITLNADADASGAGAIAINSATLNSNGGNITLGGGANPLTTAAYGTASNNHGIDLNAATLNASGGNISLRGNGYSGAIANSFGINGYNGTAIQTNGTGTLALTGRAGDATGNSYGINLGTYITGGTSFANLSAVNGNISLRGYGGNSSDSEGIMLQRVNIAASGNGGILLSGESGEGTTYGWGTDLYGNNTISSVNGNIQIFGGAFGGGNTIGIENYNSTIQTTGTGNITLSGVSIDTTSTYSAGISNYYSTIRTLGGGNIFLSGIIGDANTNNNTGIYNYGSTIESTGSSGNVMLVGTANGTNSNSYGIWINSATTIKSNYGLVAVQGSSASGMDVYSTDNTSIIGGVNQYGNIVLMADSFDLQGSLLQTTGNITIEPYTDGTTIGVGTGIGDLSISDAVFSDFTYGSFTIGNYARGSALDINSAYAFSKPISFLSHGDITLSSPLTSSAYGNAFTYAAGGSFINLAGANAINTGSGRFLIYSTDPAQNTLGGIASDFVRYSCSFGGSCPSLGAGNGLLYRIAPPPAVATVNNISTPATPAAPALTVLPLLSTIQASQQVSVASMSYSAPTVMPSSTANSLYVMIGYDSDPAGVAWEQ